MHLELDFVANTERSKAIDTEIGAIESRAAGKAHGVAPSEEISSAAVEIYRDVDRRGYTMKTEVARKNESVIIHGLDERSGSCLLYTSDLPTIGCV